MRSEYPAGCHVFEIIFEHKPDLARHKYSGIIIAAEEFSMACRIGYELVGFGLKLRNGETARKLRRVDDLTNEDPTNAEKFPTQDDLDEVLWYRVIERLGFHPYEVELVRAIERPDVVIGFVPKSNLQSPTPSEPAHS